MADIITTLHKKGDNTVNVYPNIKGENIPSASITQDKLANGSVGTNQIVANAVTSAKIANNAVTASKIASNAVTNTKIEDGAVTTSKLANGAVDNSKIATGAISNSHIQDGTIMHQKLSSGLNKQIYRYTHNVLLRVDDSVNGYINVSFQFTNNYSIPYTSFSDVIQALKDKYAISDPIIANGLYKDEFYIFQVELLVDDTKLDLIGNKLDNTGSTAETLNENDVTDVIDQMV